MGSCDRGRNGVQGQRELPSELEVWTDFVDSVETDKRLYRLTNYGHISYEKSAGKSTPGVAEGGKKNEQRAVNLGSRTKVPLSKKGNCVSNTSDYPQKKGM